MKKIKIELKQNSYNILIEQGISEKLNLFLNQYFDKKILVIIDENVSKLYLKKISAQLAANKRNVFYFIAKGGERAKSLGTVKNIYNLLLEKNFSRDSLILAIGGGVVGDLSAFTASTFMRGIKLIHIPTSLLAMVDSSIGGKTAVNFNLRKNLIGTFYQPELVLIDPNFLNSLPKEEMRSGLGEVVKYAFLSNKKFFDYIDTCFEDLLNNNCSVIEDVIFESASIKASVVEKDEKETDLRKILNLGHTFGHAFESIAKYKLKHGYAVSIGIIGSLILSEKMGLISSSTLNDFIILPNKIAPKVNLEKYENEDIFKLILSDKKLKNGKINFVLLKNIGEILINVFAEKKDIFYALNKTKLILGK